MIRITLKELLAVVGLAALGCAALKYANDVWLGVVAALVFLMFFRALIIAAVNRGPAQAFALGMTLVMAGYALVIVSSRTSLKGSTSNTELSKSGLLPTTQLLALFDRNISEFRWIDQSGHVDQDFQAPAILNNIDLTPEALRERLRNGQRLPGVSFKGMSLQKAPDEDAFFRIGHFLWALMLGVIGGVFARSAYQRRVGKSLPNGRADVNFFYSSSASGVRLFSVMMSAIESLTSRYS